jgi:dienelactone hydrolase
MNAPWVKPGIWGAVIGSVLTMIIGFGWGGWVTAGTADQVARQQANAAVTSAPTPVCLAKAKRDPASAKKVGELRAIDYSYQQQQFVIEAGWASMPGSDEPNRQVAETCASQLLKTAEAK